MARTTDTAQWREAVAHMESLQAMGAGEQAEALARLRAEDPAAWARVCRMLAAETDAPFEGWVVDAVAPADLAGRQAGPYRFVEPIGEGGMGQVWAAERTDGRFEGRVAIKLLGIFSSPAWLERFRREGQLLARLAHPGIARLLDAGALPTGQPYLVLELVQGRHLGRHCDEQRLTIGQRIDLMLKVCDAVTHAHANLVVHRDLKASNILVTDEGAVKLLDFGVAKLLADGRGGAPETELTHEFGRAMTPEYAAPEQVTGGPITVATDVYALGVLLYRLLCGRRPYGSSGATAAQWAHDIVETEPAPLAAAEPDADAAAARASSGPALRRALRGDLETIVAKALKKQPGDRYASVRALAEDLERVRDHRPVLARPDSLAYRGARFVRRHRVGVAAGALVVMAVLGGAGAALWQAQRAQAEAARAEGVKRFVVGLLDESRSERRGVAVNAMTVSDLLAAAEARVRSELTAQPDVRDEVYTLLTELQSSQGRTDRALALAQARVAAAEQAWGPDDARVAPALVYRAAIRFNGMHDRASIEADLARARGLLDGAGDRTSLARAQLLMWTGMAQTRAEPLGRWDDNDLPQAVRLLRERHPDSEDYEAALPMAARAALRHQRADDALRLADEMLAVVARRHGAQHARVALAQNVRMNALRRLGRHDEAAAAGMAGLEVTRTMLGEAHPDWVTLNGNLALALVAAGRLDEARRHLEAAHDALARHHAGNDRLAQALQPVDQALQQAQDRPAAAPAR